MRAPERGGREARAGGRAEARGRGAERAARGGDEARGAGRLLGAGALRGVPPERAAGALDLGEGAALARVGALEGAVLARAGAREGVVRAAPARLGVRDGAALGVVRAPAEGRLRGVLRAGAERVALPPRGATPRAGRALLEDGVRARGVVALDRPGWPLRGAGATRALGRRLVAAASRLPTPERAEGEAVARGALSPALDGLALDGLEVVARSAAPSAAPRVVWARGARRDTGADGRLIGLPRVVVAAATGFRPTVGTLRAPAPAERVGAAARGSVPARSEALAARPDVVDAPTRGARRFTDVTASGPSRDAPAMVVLEGALGAAVERRWAVLPVEPRGLSLYRVLAT